MEKNTQENPSLKEKNNQRRIEIPHMCNYEKSPLLESKDFFVNSLCKENALRFRRANFYQFLNKMHIFIFVVFS